MKKNLIQAAVAAALLSAAYVPYANAQGTAELAELKAQLQALQAKVEEMEQAQKTQTEAQDRTTDMIAQQRANVGDWVSRFQWKGDLRYRNETIDQEFTAQKRNRDRIRLRAGFFARVNDTLRVEVQASTDEPIGGNGDARSSNVTLSDANSRKRFDLDTAYAEWTPNAYLKGTFGKMRYPWIRPTGSLFFDGDINPEGASFGWQQGTTGLFATAFYTQLAERSAAADSTMAGAQIGWRGDIASGMRLTLAGAYFDHGAVEGWNAVQNADIANAFGNSTSTSAALCRPGVTACIANDFNVIEAFGELAIQMAGKPLTFFVDYAKNNDAERSAITDQSLDTAYAGGVTFGRVATAHSWELGYLYQKVENDALYGQWVDSDFAGGNTGSQGHVFRFGYGFARNFRINATYFMNDTNIDVPVTIGGAPVNDREYERLQLDLNMTF
jgi:multidrug efflux pump subunit AcrA (membrane-fusion protein)